MASASSDWIMKNVYTKQSIFAVMYSIDFFIKTTTAR